MTIKMVHGTRCKVHKRLGVNLSFRPQGYVYEEIAKTLHWQVAEKHRLRRLLKNGQMQGTRNPEE
jgi:hypothetical protein